MSRRTPLLLLVTVLAVGTTGSSAQNPVLQAAMRQKLTTVQQLLEPVIRADYPAIERHAEALSWITETEIASWQAVADPEYTRQAALFLLAVDGLREAAAARTIEGVTLEYTTLVSSCIRCHTYLRGSRRASADLPDLLRRTR